MTVPDAPWPPLPDRWDADADAVDVVRIDVERACEDLSVFDAALADVERDRALRFRRLADRQRYVVARGGLRLLLTSVLRTAGADVEPREARIEQGPWGKPYVVGHPGLGVNVSHAGAMVLLALSRGREVGVDIEHARPDIDVDDLASVALTEGELRWWGTVPRPQRHPAFFFLWTRREALAKAVGTGLGKTEVPWKGPGAGAPEEVIMEGRLWTVCQFMAAPSYPAAVAADGAGWYLRKWSYRHLGD